MIPIMYIQKKDKLFVDKEVIVSKMNADYSNIDKTLLIKITYNLDDYFEIGIELDEFDMPTNIFIKKTKTNKYSITDSNEYYIVESENEILEIKKKDILKIANNIATKTDINSWVIKAKTLNIEYNSEEFKIDYFNMNKETDTIVFFLNNKKIMYHVVNYEPVLLIDDNLELKPFKIYHNYVCFNIDNIDVALIHPNNIHSYYLFRQTTELLDIEINKNTLKTKLNTYKTDENNLIVNNIPKSIISFLSETYNQEYKQFIVSATLNNNIYTPSIILTGGVKHHSIVMFDLEQQDLFYSDITFEVCSNKNKVSCLKIELTNLKSFSFNTNHKNISSVVIEIPIDNIIKILSLAKIPTSELIDIYINGNLIALSSIPVDPSSTNSYTATSEKYIFSINSNFINNICSTAPNLFNDVISVIDVGIVYKNNCFIKSILVDEQNIIYKKGNLVKETNKTDENIVLSSNIFKNVEKKFNGISFVKNIRSIEFNYINPIIKTETLMLIKKLLGDVLFVDILKNTNNLKNTIAIQFDNAVWGIILDSLNDVVYYINYSNNTITANTKDEQLNLYMNVTNEGYLKRFLESYSSKDDLIHMYDCVKATEDGKEIFIENIIPYSLLDFNINTNSTSLIKNKDDILKLKDNTKLRPIFNGVFASDSIEIQSVTKNKNNIEIVFNIKNKIKTFILPIKEEAIVGKKISLFNGEQTRNIIDKGIDDTVFSYIDKNIGVIKIEQDVGEPLKIGVDLQLWSTIIQTNNLLINNSFYFALEDYVYMVKYKNKITKTSIGKNDFIIAGFSIKETYSTSDDFVSNTISEVNVFPSNKENKKTLSYGVINNNSIYAIRVPISKVIHIQEKD